MKMSVILPCFNGAATIAVQLEALTRQAWPDGWEVIVSNNGSTDDSMKIVEQYRARLPGLRTVDAHVPGTPRLGVPHTYNVGIAAATGDAFAFAEADDEVGEGWLAAMGNALREHSFVAARLEHRKLNPEWVYPPVGNGYQYDGLLRASEAPPVYMASAAGFGFTRALYEKLGPLSIDFSIVHDSEYCWRAQLAGYKLHFEPRAVVHYREKTSSRDRFRQALNWGADSMRLEAKYRRTNKKYMLLRYLLGAGRMLPQGLRAGVLRAVRAPQGRQMFADWVWSFGWTVGQLKSARKRQ
jgi:GT2 family glycosyltransferase